MALSKKVMEQTIQISATRLFARIRLVTTSNPPWVSITSTTVIAPIKKKAISAVPISVSDN